jgi:hypothetical protein
MRLLDASVTAVAVAIAISGCAATGPTSAGDFQGAESDVATVVDDLQKAARSGNPEKMCDDIFTKELADQFKAGASDCTDQVQDAIRDATEDEFEVTDVTVTGNTATAKVRQPETKRTGTFSFERIGNGWRLSAIG